MNKSIHSRFKELQGEFDINEPEVGHFKRFEAKLSQDKKPKFNFWKPLAIAASLLLLISFGWSYLNNRIDLKDVSPKMNETQSYFASTIRQELLKINKLKTADNKKVIKDALVQIDILEYDYKKLTVQLKESGKDKRIIFAMINNYQKRIEILKSLLIQINRIKQYKYKANENKLI